jgi:Dolichyl-phosphate-mannose-protein mannosyltransferase
LEKFNGKFTTFFLTALKVLMILVIVASSEYIEDFNKSSIIVGVILLSIIAIEFYIIKKNICYKKQIILILICGFILRGLWLLNINSIPISDFRVIYECGQEFLSGNTGMFWGHSYIARFPHLTIMVLYMALMIKVFPTNNIIMMKLVNLTLGVLTIYIIYLLCRELFNSKKKGIYAASLASIFPPFITYTGVFCTENIAIPLYLLSIYIFILVIKNKKSKYYLILSGLLLSIGNLFRMVAPIVVIAYAIYILIYLKDKIIHKLRNIALYIVPYVAFLVLISVTLQSLKITEFPLWKGSEPKVTSILKGSNLESNGRWNEEDAAIVEKYNYDYEKIQDASLEIIKERLTKTPPLELVKFYIKKIALQWNEGDFGGVYWTKLGVPEEDIIVDVSLEVLQIVYLSVMVLIFIGFFNRKNNKDNQEINLLYIILCGYGVMYLVTESQGRYAYIISWIFIILSMEGINFILNKFKISNIEYHNKDKKNFDLHKI